MRVLHISAAYSPFIGGAETYLRAMSERLVQDGHHVAVLASDATRAECFWNPRSPRVSEASADFNGVQVVRSRVEHLPLSPWSFHVLRRLGASLAQLPCDTRFLLDWLAQFMPWIPALERSLEALPHGFAVVHGVNIALEWPLIAGWRYARRRGLAFVATPFVHVGDREVQRFYTMPHQMAVLRDADRVIVQTEIEANELIRLGAARERVVVLGMGVDLHRLECGDATRFRAQHGVEGPVVTFMGAITDDKGAVHLLHAMQRLWRAGSDATLVLAGQPVSPSTFEQAYRGLPEAHRLRVRRMGLVTGQVKQDMLAATDVFALPSRVDSFGIVYLEAWAYGVPVIGCHAGGAPDVIDDGEDGLLVRFGDQAALASAIGALLADPDRRRAMGACGRAKVEARYTWDRIYRRLVDIYAEVLDRHLAPERQGEHGNAPAH
jgi:glycogen(starch) synthase